MTNIVPFAFEDQPVRIVMQGDDPWFVLADVCAVLDVRNSRDAADRLDDDEKGVATVDTLGGPSRSPSSTKAGFTASR